MEVMVTQGSVNSALSRIEESYCVGDVIIASTAVIGSGVVLRAEPGCSITIRDGVCIGSGVILHATEGSLELHQGVCLAGGVLIIGKGYLGDNTCIGAGSTLINPAFSEGSIVSGHSLWGDESRKAEPILGSDVLEKEVEPTPDQCELPKHDSQASSTPEYISDPWVEEESHKSSAQPPSNPQGSEQRKSPESAPLPDIPKQVIGIQQFEMMVQKMFPDREAFRKSQQ